MKTAKKMEEPPSPSDFDGWKAIVAQDRLNCLRPEDILAAIQRIGPNGDQRLLSALITHISERLTRIIRPRVKRTYHNEGKDIVERTHDQLIEAILRPNSADGKQLRKKFMVCVKKRLIDAIRAELRYARGNQPPKVVTSPGDEAGDAKKIPEPVDNKPADYVEQMAYVEGLLNKISDPKKREAFRLHMDGCPIESEKGSTSIAQQLGISPKTAGKWIAEIQDLLKNEVGEPHDQTK